MSAEPEPESNSPPRTAAEERRAREAEALRANLRRRKQQARSRAEQGSDAPPRAAPSADDPA